MGLDYFAKLVEPTSSYKINRSDDLVIEYG